MKTHLIWECDICGKQSSDKVEIAKCEAEHLGMTIEEKIVWEQLKERVKRKGYIVSVCKNEKNEKEFDDAIAELLKYEKKFGICE